jgi:hypothetical protein
VLATHYSIRTGMSVADKVMLPFVQVKLDVSTVMVALDCGRFAQGRETVSLSDGSPRRRERRQAIKRGGLLTRSTRNAKKSGWSETMSCCTFVCPFSAAALTGKHVAMCG